MRFHVQNVARPGGSSRGFDDSVEDTIALEIGQGGVATMVSLDQDDEVNIPGVVGPDEALKAAIVINGESIEFEVDGARDDDEAHIRVMNAEMIRVQIVHSVRVGPCRARCYDGTEGQPCVDCVRDGRTVRICC